MNNARRLSSPLTRYADLAGTELVAETEKVFDQLGRVTDIVHERAATDFADYDLTWDAAGRISDFDFDSLVGDDGAAAYSYDDTNQLTGSDYASDWQTDESYVYDDNGNRTLVNGSTTYTTGDHNRLTSDGTYNYTYDNEGNVLTKTNISTSESVEYTWDHRNRLVKVTFKNSGGTATKIIEYGYDYGQRWVRKTLDTNADGTIEESRVFVHDNGQIVLDFEKTGTSAASNSDLAHRYLWGNSVDQLLADESVDDGGEDDTAWALTDHLNSVRDLVIYDPVTGTVSVVKHVTFDAFGNVTSDSATGVRSLLLYTARPFDPDTDLQNNLNRWYDLSTGRWMSVDPIGFEAGDVNLYCYVGNGVAALGDPTGLWSEPPRYIVPEPPGYADTEGPGYSDMYGWSYPDQEDDWRISFAGMSIDVQAQVKDLRASIQISPAECGGLKWNAFVAGNLKLTFAGSKRKGLWTERVLGRNYGLWYRISVSGQASAGFAGAAAGKVCPPKTLKGLVQAGTTASVMVIPTASAGVSFGEHLSATGMVTGVLTAKASVSASLDLETGRLLFSLSPPTFTGTASALVLATIRKPDGTDLTYQFSKELF